MIKKLLPIIIIGLLISGFATAQAWNFWRYNTSGGLNPVEDVDLGATDDRINKGWFTDFDVSGVFDLGGTFGGNVDMDSYIITNIGDTGTDFDTSGGLTLAGTLTVTGTSTLATTTLSGDLILGDDQSLYFDTAKTYSLRYSSDHSSLVVPVDISAEGAFAIYSNTDVDGGGNWEPYLQFFADGHINLQNTAQGTSTNRYFLVNIGEGIWLTTTNSYRAKIKADNIASSDKLFQHPNQSGTYLIATGTQDIETSGTLTVTATSTFATTTLSGDLILGDDQELYFDTAKLNYIKYDSNYGLLRLEGDFPGLASDASLSFYADGNDDGTGNFEPYIRLDDRTGSVILVGTFGTANQLEVYMYGGLALSSRVDSTLAIIKNDNTTSQRTFQLPNLSGTFLMATGTQDIETSGNLTVSGYVTSTTYYGDGSNLTGVAGGGQTLYDAVVDAAGGGDYTTIEAAFDDGAIVVFVRNGTYNPVSDIDLPTGGNLVGESRDGVILDFEDAAGVNINAASGNDDITVENLTIQNCQGGSSVGSINFVNTDRSIVRGVHFAGGNDQAVEFDAGNSNMVTECHFGTTAGANDSTFLKIDSAETIISNNTGRDIDRAFVLAAAAQIIVANNNIECNVSAQTFVETSTNANSIVISGNVVEAMIGVRVNEDSATIIGNHFRGSGGSGRDGVLIGSGGERTLVVGNRFYEGDIGVDIDAGADNCIVVGNYFRSMLTQAVRDNSVNSYVQGNYGNNEGERAVDERKIMWMKNTSGDSLGLGNSVVFKTVAAGDEITTTTTQGDDLVYGMVLETIANAAYGKIQVTGKTAALKVDGTADIAIGDFLGTFTTAGIAMKAVAGDMTFAIALEAYTTDDSSGVIDALLISPRKL